jgi:hypothetical protein
MQVGVVVHRASSKLAKATIIRHTVTTVVVAGSRSMSFPTEEKTV